MELNKLQIIVNEQREFFAKKNKGLIRNINFQNYVNNQQIVIITGIRRSGKSTLLLQFAEQFTDFHFVNFDDERFVNFTVDDFQTLMTVLHKRSNSKNVFFDEIQNIPQWERFIRRLHDNDYKIFITGSNAYLLSSELSTHLTGRYLRIELFPFSFSEFLNFKNIEIENLTTSKISNILKAFDQYLKTGGFPEYAKTENPEILQRTYEDIIYRDVIARYKIQEIKSFKQLSQYLMTNIAKEFTYHSISKNLGFKSPTSVKNYIHYLESVYMFFELYKYDYSLKKQFINNKKIFTIDNGLRNCIAFTFSEDIGRIFENLIFIELKRRQNNVFYFRNHHECDFVIENQGKITVGIQVCYNLESSNLERETNGLIEASEILNLQERIIITYSEEKQIEVNNKTIRIIPAWQFLLNFYY